jgi:hypothetical protein
MAIRKYNRPPARPLGRSLAQHFTTRSKKEVFSLDGPGSTSMATWFLGPKAENQVWFENLVLRALRSHAQSRLNYCPTDPPYVTPEIRNTAAFKDGKLLLENALDALLDELKGCVPFYSHRWQGHMNWDTTLPGLVGLIATLPYNPNNVAAEASPVTTYLEMMVGDDLCNMLGFIVPKGGEPETTVPRPWGHITCDGSVANLEGMWFARNLKLLAPAIATAIEEVPELALARELMVSLPDGIKQHLIRLSPWQLMNITADEAIRLSQRLSSEFGIDPKYLDTNLPKYTIQDLGWLGFYLKHAQRLPKSPPLILTPATAHYSWPKNAAILGIGDANRTQVRVDQDGRMDLTHLRALLDQYIAAQQPILQVVAVLGSTEEGAVDPLDSLLQLRDEYRLKGMDFLIHVDAAWGGYLVLAFRFPPTSKINSAPCLMWNPSPSIRTRPVTATIPLVPSAIVTVHFGM